MKLTLMTFIRELVKTWRVSFGVEENLVQSDAVTWLVPVNSKVSESLQDFQENVILTSKLNQ